MDVAVMISLKGMKANALAKPYINQDRAFILELAPRFTAYAVFDGHGANGHLVAEFISNVFKKALHTQFYRTTKKLTGNDILRFILDLFAHANVELESAGIDVSHSGCTSSVAIRYMQSIYVGYVGDSKVATVHFNGKKPYRFMETPEHNPACPGEAERIRQAGSSITVVNVPFFTKPISRIVEAGEWLWVVFSENFACLGLSVSRSFGDMAARRHGVTAIPDLIKFDIQHPSSAPLSRYPLILVVASDGLWDTASYLDLLEHINNNVQPQQKLLARTRRLAEVAWRRRIAAEGRADDTTVIVALMR